MSVKIVRLNSFEEISGRSSPISKILLSQDFKTSKPVRLLLNDLFSLFYYFFHPNYPSLIELETVNRCNNSCSFCPVNAKVDTREYKIMSDSLIDKIVDDLERNRYSGRLGLFSNNEPLLDKRIAEICRLFRKKARLAHIYLYTNGKSINLRIFEELFEAGLDELVINNYNDGFALNKPVSSLMEQIDLSKDPKIELFASKTVVYLRRVDEILNSRGGHAPNKTKDINDTFALYSNHSCPLPFIQFVIRPSGKISACCQDALGQVTMGDLNTQTISEIWNGAEYRRFRREITRPFGSGRKALSVCNCCDHTPLSSVREAMKR